MASDQRQENLEEIKREIEKSIKKNKNLSQEEMNKIMEEANENIDFLNTLKEIDISSPSKRVIFVDGKACLVYDNGVFYVEDSVDSRKNKKKLTRQQATELYVEYFFRYIMNPAIQQKKMVEQVRKIAVKAKKEPVKKEPKRKVKLDTKETIKNEEPKKDMPKIEKSKEDMVR